MIFSKIFLVALAAGSVTAFTLPSNLADGSYRARSTENGLEIHERHIQDNVWETVHTGISKDVKRDGEPASPLQKRGDCGYLNTGLGSDKGCFTIWCGCGFTLNHADCDAAVADLKTQPDRYGEVPAYAAHYSIRGSVVAFACNIWGGLNGIGPVSYSATMVTRVLQQEVSYKCGSYIAGTGNYGDLFLDDDYPDLGYMRYENGLDFCRHARDAGVDRC